MEWDRFEGQSTRQKGGGIDSGIDRAFLVAKLTKSCVMACSCVYDFQVFCAKPM